MSVAPIGILADDLTGAMDTGMQLVPTGNTVRIALDASALPGIASGADCLVISSESRNIPPERARHVVREACRALQAAGCGVVYKKVDSTLRGNLGAEMEAFIGASGKAVLLAPALPSLGRTTEGGIQYVQGVPLDQTDLAQDPFAPVRHAQIGALLATQIEMPSAPLPVLTAQNEAAQAARVDALMAQGVRIFYADAVCQEGLDRLARWMLPRLDRMAPCGSAGWMQSLAELLLTRRAWTPPVLTKQEAPLLILSASPAASNKEQMRILQDTHPEIKVVTPDLALLGGDAWHAHGDALVDETIQSLACGKTVLVDAAAGSKGELLARYQDQPEILARNSDAIQRLLSALARRVADIPLGALLLLGGDTALHVCQALGAAGLQIDGEALPYIPLGRMLGAGAPQMPVITKAGGFGTPDALKTLYERLC